MSNACDGCDTKQDQSEYIPRERERDTHSQRFSLQSERASVALTIVSECHSAFRQINTHV